MPNTKTIDTKLWCFRKFHSILLFNPKSLYNLRIIFIIYSLNHKMYFVVKYLKRKQIQNKKRFIFKISIYWNLMMFKKFHPFIYISCDELHRFSGHSHLFQLSKHFVPFLFRCLRFFLSVNFSLLTQSSIAQIHLWSHVNWF